jgi:predicted dehydrogenase
MTPDPVEAVLIGAGDRGTFAYGRAAIDQPDTLHFVAVAEPDPARRQRFAVMHRISTERCFASWEELIEARPPVQAAVCCALDRDHAGPAVAALNAGYDVLLEKPMAATAEDCIRIVRAQERSGRLLMLCHVLRYAPFFAALHDVVSSGRLGDLITVEHRENVAFWHMAHSYVRGNWRNQESTSPMILAKCCHDLDQIVWNLPDTPVTHLHSFGSLSHFRPEHAPEGAPARCTDGCPAAETCPFYAPRIYLTDNTGWPTQTISVDLSYESRLHALQTGPYGRCVYHCDNTVVDHQVVTMEHAGGTVSTLTMQGHSDVEERTMRYDGTRATLRARHRHTGGSEITLHDHLTGSVERLKVDEPRGGHGGGDALLLRAFADAVRAGATDSMTSARTSLESHLLAFAAERSRADGAPVDMARFRAETEVAAVSA